MQQQQEQPQEVAREKIRLVLVDKVVSVYTRDIHKLTCGDYVPVGFKYNPPPEITKCIELIKTIDIVKYAELTSTLCGILVIETREKTSAFKEHVKTTVALLTPDQLFRLCTEYSL
jgi:hypothetical protein